MSAFPMILVVVILYNLVAFGGGMGGHGDMQTILAHSFPPIPMFSGAGWKITVSDLFVALALALLFIEIVKAARNTHREILNHAFSMVTFCVALVEFIVLKGFSTSAFFLITAMCLFDVVAGYTISIVAARRDVGVMAMGRDDR
jgi:hypothetical protein